MKIKTINIFLLIFLIFEILLVSSSFKSYRINHSSNVYNNYNKYEDKLDFSLEKNLDKKDIVEKIRLYPNIKNIYFGDNVIDRELKEYLVNEYPNINVIAYSYSSIYEKEYPENITYLDLTDVNVDNNLFYSLKNFPNLKVVKIGGNSLNNNDKLLLAEEYKNINFSWNIMVANKYVPSDIEELDLTDKNVGNFKDFVNTISLFPNLKKLNMTNTNLSDEQLGYIENLFPNMNVIWKISFGKWSTNTDVLAFSTLVTHFDYKRLTDSDIKVLEYCKNLQALDLGHQNLTDLSFIANNFSELRILILADNRKLKDISSVKKLKHLHYLEFFINDINDITAISELKELVDLNLSYNRIKDLSPLINNPLPMLERLWLVGVPVSQEQIKELKAVYPNTKIITKSGGGSTDYGWRSHKRYFKMIEMFYNQYFVSEEFSKYDK